MVGPALAKTGRRASARRGSWPQGPAPGATLRPCSRGTGGGGPGQGEVKEESTGRRGWAAPGPPHTLCPSSSTPSTHWAPRTPTRKTNWRQRQDSGGQCSTDIVQRERRSPGRPYKERGGGGGWEGAGLHMPPLPGATALSGERSAGAIVPGHTGCHPPDGCVLWPGQFSGPSEGMQPHGRLGRHLLPQTLGTGGPPSARRRPSLLLGFN